MKSNFSLLLLIFGFLICHNGWASGPKFKFTCKNPNEICQSQKIKDPVERKDKCDKCKKALHVPVPCSGSGNIGIHACESDMIRVCGSARNAEGNW